MEQTLSCKDAGQYDHTNKLKFKVTGWGAFSKTQSESGKSRKARIRRGEGKRGGLKK